MHRVNLPIALSAAFLTAGTSVHAAMVTLGDTSLGGSQQDGWSSNLHVLQGTGPGGEVYSYTNTSGDAEVVTPISWSYLVGVNRGRVTPFLTLLLDPANLENPSSMEVAAVGTTRVSGVDYNDVGIFTHDFGGGSFTLEDGESFGISVIDADPDGTNNGGSVIPFDGANSGDNNHWYSGNGAANTYNPAGTTPLSVGHVFGGNEAADINRNYQFNVTVDVSPVPEPAAGILGLLGLGFLLRRRRR